ncbi:PIN domain-containing protein [Luteolibacter sp. Populi]|uniref:PIN domain-containing protein n=1 Tax=Luteolibacter sp. Populi TaxID=3230487 RepID=UPI003466443E
MRVFLDTNVLLYAVSTAASEKAKRAVALELLDDPEIVLSTQVLQEFYVQATRATRADALSHGQASLLIESWLRFEVVSVTVEIVVAALSTKNRWRLSYWDSAILEAARSAGCSVVLSEDMQIGQDFDGVKVVNPFKPAK